MQSIWKGAISFGLVHVPVKMFTATENKGIHLRMVHKKCGTPIKNQRICPQCETNVSWEDITRGYEYEKGHFVLFEENELEVIKPETTKAIQIVDFVNLKEIDPIYFQKAFYLSPDQSGMGAYNLLLQAMQESGKIGIAKIAIRSKSSLAAIRPMGNCICLETMFYPDEIRSVQEVTLFPKKKDVDKRELEMAKKLIEGLSRKFDPKKYKDDYRVCVEQAVQKKISGKEIVSLREDSSPGNVIDLMSALQASLDSVKSESKEKHLQGKKPKRPIRKQIKSATKKKAVK